MLLEPPVPYKKEKIGSYLSYPLKFSEILAALSPAVERLSIRVWFRAWKSPRQNEKRDKYHLISAEYCGPGPLLPQPTWWLLVRPVPRDLRAAVRSVLMPDGLERVREWYLSHHTPNWQADSHKFEMRFVTGSESLEYDNAA